MIRALSWVCAAAMSAAIFTGNIGVQTVFAEETATNKSEIISVENDGRKIPATVVIPEGEGPFPLVVMNHGFAGSRDEGTGFVQIAEALADQGIASVRLDFAGCGDSEASFLDFNLDNNMSDSFACKDYVVENYPIDENKLGIFGYSMGGRMSLCINQSDNNPYKAIALLAPAASCDEDTIAQQEENIAAAEENGGFVEIEWYGNTLQVSGEHYQKMLDTMNVIQNLKPVCETMVVYGTEDEMVPPDVNESVIEALEAESLAVEGANHGYGFYEENSPVTDTVKTSIADFFAEKL